MINKILYAAMLAALLPCTVNAQSSGGAVVQKATVTDEAGERLSYTYVQAGYGFDTRIDPVGNDAGTVDVPEADGNGYAIQLSYDISPRFHVLGDFNQSWVDGAGLGDQDLFRYRAGIGWHSESGANANNSYFANLTFERYDLQKVADANGYGAEIGWRHGFTTGYLSRVELDVSAQLIDLDNGTLLDNDVGAKGVLLYDITQRFAAYISYEDNQILKETLVGVRGYF